MKYEEIEHAPKSSDIQRVTKRAIGILKDQDKAWVMIALRYALNTIKNKEVPKFNIQLLKDQTKSEPIRLDENLKDEDNTYWVYYQNWSRLLTELKEVDNRL